MSKPKTPAARFNPATDEIAARFNVAKRLTQPTHKFVVGIPSVVQIKSQIESGLISKGRGDKAHDVAVLRCAVLNVRTDAIESMIVPPDIVAALRAAYHDDGFIDKFFQITKRDRKTGANGVTYSCDELEPRNHD